jgi:Kef-type K+ transport system membrane component KefB
MPVEELFFEIGIVLIIAAAFSLLVYRFRQPLIIAYIITGVIVGPSVLALAKNPEIFEVMSQIGMAFLLFTVGLGLNWRSVKDVGGIAFATGVGQVLFTSVSGFLIGLTMGFDAITSIYIAVAFSFSSTIIIIKLLMDKEDLDTLYGRISVGFLLVQDFVAMLILLGLSAVGSGAPLEQVFIGVIVKAFLIVPLLWVISVKILPRMLAYAARSQELLFIFSVAWCFFIAGILVSFGFGIELGALIAGITLSGSIFQQEINSRVRPLRDFFLIIFFIVLGTRLGLDNFTAMLIPTIIFSAFILIGNPLIVMFIMRSLGYHPRTGFLAGTTVAQISEFSFIVIAAGIATGHLSDEILALATAVGIFTIAISSYLIDKNENIYEKLKPVFRWMEPANILDIERVKERKATKIILFGFHRAGRVLLDTIKKMKKSYIIVDFDPQTVRQLSEVGEPNLYGDAGDEVFLEEIKADKASLVISTIPDVVISSSLLSFLKSRKYKGTVIVSVHTQVEADVCYKLGATYVIVPTVLSGRKFSEILDISKTNKRSWVSVSKEIREAIIENGIKA